MTFQSSLLEILSEVVTKTLDHSTSRLPGENQMYMMYMEKAAQAISSLIEMEVIGKDEEPLDIMSPELHKFGGPYKEELLKRLWIANGLRSQMRAVLKEDKTDE